MRMFLLAALFATATASAALAGDEAMAPFFGNTAIVTGGMADTHTYYNADHSFTLKAPTFGMEWKGTWKIEGPNLCRIYEKPPPGVTNPFCTVFEPHKVGETWTMTLDGKTRTISLVKGIQ
ncbi:MAG TPA: hypothetical protein VHU87_02830 [Rhizomicrobium sp.]|jgi:hypothetical protein|nr:hypothetical protein [Rhizomicrobium sp.]